VAISLAKGLALCIIKIGFAKPRSGEINPKYIFHQTQFHNFSKIAKTLLENLLFYDVLFDS
jgi:hypothetical protein